MKMKSPIILGNTEQLIEILLELARNSLAALRRKGGKISISLTQKKNNFLIIIQDNGPGIPNRIKKDIFKKQLQSENSKSTGLGLFFSYKIIKELGGKLTLSKTSKSGTTFTITLPKYSSEEMNNAN